MLNGWYRKFAKGVELAHCFHNDVAKCGYTKEEKRDYILIDIKNLPEQKICQECKKGN